MLFTQEKYWFIAIVGHNTEQASADKLAEEFEVFLPAQKVVSIWKDGRRKVRNKILLPRKLLIHCTEQERMRIVNLPFIKRFMVDSASEVNEFGRRSVATIPDDQMERFKFLLGQEDAKVEIDNLGLKMGEKVRVIRGTFAGLEGIVSDWTSPSPKLHIVIDHLGCASVEIALDSIERIKN